MTTRFFRAHGEFCASYPWEVIVATLTLTACMLTVDQHQQQTTQAPRPPLRYCVECLNDPEYNAADVTVMTLIRVLAILYSYYQFLQLHKLGSKYILGIAGLFTVFSSFIFTSTVLNFLRFDVTDLKDALFFFLLLIDLSKAAMLAEFALSASNQEEVRTNIARGMSVLGPSITLDTIVETLVIGVGTLSGVHRLEMLSCFACLSVIVNYIVFMTFYPACLSLILELSRTKLIYGKANLKGSLLSRALKEEDQKPNPVVQRVKLIMSFGLMLVHAHSWWPVREEDDAISPLVEQRLVLNRTEETALHGYIMKWVTLSADHIVILILLLALVVKFIFFENNEELAQLRVRMSAERDESSQGGDGGTSTAEDSLARGGGGTERFRYRPAVDSATCFGMLPEGIRVRNVPQGAYVDPKLVYVRYPPAPFADTEDKEVQTDSSPDQKLKEAVAVEALVQMSTMSMPIESSAAMDLTCKKELTSECKAELIDMKQELSDVSIEEQPAIVLIPPRPMDECRVILKSVGAAHLTDLEVIKLVKSRDIQAYSLEKTLNNPERGVVIRRKVIGEDGKFSEVMDDLPYRNYDYSKVLGACCENVIGYVPIPVGIAGPLLLDGHLIHVPMATTEGCLVASTNRGSRALTMGKGVVSRIVADGMSRGPVVRFPSMERASEAMGWLETDVNYALVKDTFDSSSRFARLTKIHIRIAGRLLFIRFVAKTGDAMGMNMLSKGTEKSLNEVLKTFPDMEILSVSGNFCTDKKPAAVNWIEGRGKSVVCEAIVSKNVIETVLKTSTHALCEVNVSKNMIGSAIAGSIGGFNAHAANVVTAIFLATGQDPAQNVTSSNCMTLMEPWGENGEDLYISVTMPSIEIGTIGGGTILAPQGACLSMLGVRGAHPERPGENANQLARIVCGAVLAGELSLMSALTAGHLVKSHLRHNRSSLAEPPSPLPSPSSAVEGVRVCDPSHHQ